MAIGMALFIGYKLIFMLESTRIYNRGIAIFMPWLPVFLLILIIVVCITQFIYISIAVAPPMLIASSYGGVLAHDKRISERI
jgi:hypothetical protein